MALWYLEAFMVSGQGGGQGAAPGLKEEGGPDDKTLKPVPS